MEKLLAETKAAGRGFTAAVKRRPFFECLVGELKKLRKKQEELEETIATQELLLDQVPQHFVYKDGERSYEEGRRIGSASFILTSRQLGGPTSVQLDPLALSSVCSAPLGCSITMSFRRYSFRGEEIIETQKTGPCRFEVDMKTNDWTIGSGCGSDELVTGKDGDGRLNMPGSGASVIVDAVSGCMLADADFKIRSVGENTELDTDYEPSFFLIVDPSMRDDGAKRFQCDLQVF